MTICAALLFALSSCQAASESSEGSRFGDATRFLDDLVTVRVGSSPFGAMWLERVDGQFAPIEVAADGGEFHLPEGAWRLRSTNPRAEVAPIPVPAFVERSITVRLGPARSNDEEFRSIPAGPALIGDRLGVGQPDERPVRIVEVPEFQIGRYEVTNAQFVEFLNGVEDRAAIEGLVDLRSRKCRIRRGDEGRFVTDAPDLPVVTISFEGARAYCAFRAELDDGAVYRLPTEVEWEKAARGPSSLVFSYGDVYTPSAANQESGRLREVGAFQPNEWGLHDMTGNAFEWTSDLEDVGDSGASPRVYLRGGSFVLDGIFLRNAFRMMLRPTVRADDVGFRVVREFR
ncbi:MAG: SUMF1/EgtB/PvdO family nonheme iron enzyme [Planctomycetota bacterium]